MREGGREGGREGVQGRKLSEMELADPVSLENELAAMASVESACEDVSDWEGGRGEREGNKEGGKTLYEVVCVESILLTCLIFTLSPPFTEQRYLTLPPSLPPSFPPRRPLPPTPPRKRTTPGSSTTRSSLPCSPRLNAWPLSTDGPRSAY